MKHTVWIADGMRIGWMFACQAIAAGEDRPLTAEQVQANIFWMGNRHLVSGRPYILKLATQEIPCFVENINAVVDTASLASSAY